MYLQTFRYVIVYVSVIETVRVDILYRRLSQSEGVKQKRTKCYALAVEQKVSPAEDTAFE